MNILMVDEWNSIRTWHSSPCLVSELTFLFPSPFVSTLLINLSFKILHPHSSLKNIPLLSRISCVLIVWHVCYVTPQVSCPPAPVTDCRGFLDPLLSGDISCWYWLMTGHTGWHRHSYILIMSWSIWLYNIVFKNLTTKIYTFPVSIINYTRPWFSINPSTKN